MRLAFLGTPSASVPVLSALVEAGHDVALVVTAPDRRRGRGSALVPTPVKSAALAHGLAVSSDLRDVLSVNAQLGVVVAFGSIIPRTVLDQLAMLNVHFSLLPRWRGAAPVERAILAGDTVTGVCVMGLEATLDTGPIYASATLAIEDKDAATLTVQLAHLGASLLVATLAMDHLPVPVPQTGDSTYASKLTADDFVLDPSMDVTTLMRVVRLGRAVALVGARRLRVERASAQPDPTARVGEVRRDEQGVLLGARDGYLRLVEVRPDGARTMLARSWWDGLREEPAQFQWGRVDGA